MIEYPQPKGEPVSYASEEWNRLQATLDGLNSTFKDLAAHYGWEFLCPNIRGVPARGIIRKKGFRRSEVAFTHVKNDLFLLWASVVLDHGWIRYLGLRDRVLFSKDCGTYTADQLLDQSGLRSALVSAIEAVLSAN